ncbi:putative tetraacyldisaccharide 4'-kinase [Hibiscus syriacus]|uniref:tetraacyldisaccharide 4'-kinase n=1 Tax=Hibiscus syriacus TaxID=106335 RepID=A0A6A2XC42_HIBSY|nr:probable tetraacyldisaccharide 4'-kinase, mitochondrial [Hibiscus syriacus]KAE8654227.1 putative tetraacyldisaccharide 4'-kinase [Hibiscus syriacus]
MEKLKQAVKEIAYGQNQAKFSNLHRSLIPFLSYASSLYGAVLYIRHSLYRSGFFSKNSLPVPVISVGNLTWGGNGKTPMVEFIAKRLTDYGISSLILTRGYAGGDEAKMLKRHLIGRAVKVGVGANRVATANLAFEKYGYVDYRGGKFVERTYLDPKMGSHIDSQKIGAAILDDGMQYWSLSRDLEIVMINGLMPWGNGKLLPLGPLREALTAIRRADIAVIHHADLVPEQKVKVIELVVQEIKESLPIFYTRMTPSYLFEPRNISKKMHLEGLHDAVVLCVSAIGFPDAFVMAVEKIGPLFVDQIDFSDHHSFGIEDIHMIRKRLRQLEDKFSCKPIIVVTEKDYDRDPEILKHMYPFQVVVLCSEMQIIPRKGCDEESFKSLLKELLEV